jgi:hypothetical protein
LSLEVNYKSIAKGYFVAANTNLSLWIKNQKNNVYFVVKELLKRV